MNKAHKFSSVQIWFLDADLQKSAEYLPNDALIKTISGCFQALVCTRFYFAGIRNKKAYKHFFDDDHKDETMEQFFPLWPLKQKPAFTHYTSRTSKWCRMCKEHYDYISKYLDILLLEYEYRYHKPHGLLKFVEWQMVDAPSLPIPVGNLKEINIPWKVLKLRYRRTDIIQGYRIQLMSSFEGDDPLKAYSGSNRDIPDFVVKHFNIGLD